MKVPQSEVAAVDAAPPATTREYINWATETLRGALTMIERNDREGALNRLKLACDFVDRAHVTAGRWEEADRCRR